jgi:ubiquinone/menaquinone biosynthesis C-methylase UbiE
MSTRLIQSLSSLPLSTLGRQRGIALAAARALSSRGLILPESALKPGHYVPGTIGAPIPSSDGAVASNTSAWKIVRHPSANNCDVAWDPSMIPRYLHDAYWWAYVHPLAIRFWDRHGLVNSILWGNYKHLRDQAQMEIDSCRLDRAAAAPTAPAVPMTDQASKCNDNGMSVLHVSCVYGDFDTNLVRNHLSASDTLHVVDVAPQQLQNVQRKLSLEGSSRIAGPRTVHLWQQDASNLAAFKENSMDCVILFFLLHEVPAGVRTAALSEAVRVVRPGTGRLVVVDYDRVSSRLNPFYPIMKLVLTALEPFALDLWRTPLRQTLEEAAVTSAAGPSSTTISVVRHDTFFGGLYQKLVVKKVHHGRQP